MDQEFYKDIEASSMSVDDILREFHAQEEAAEVPPSLMRFSMQVFRSMAS